MLDRPIASQSMLTWEQAKAVAEQIFFKRFGEHLKDVEIQVLQGSWEGKTYEKMSDTYFLSVNYLRGDVGNKLWQKLSQALGEEVTKTNFKGALERAVLLFNSPLYFMVDTSLAISTSSLESLNLPDGAVSLNSPLYVIRDGVESVCYQAIAKPGALVRIKAPRLMGKTSLMTRILNWGQFLNYQTVYLDLQSVERGIISDLDRFLRWLCFRVGKELALENQLKDRWDTDILGSNDNCTVYFEEYLLPANHYPLLLTLDNIDRIFPFAEVVEDFLGMLRSWHERGKVSSHWKQLRLVIAHSTECYLPLDLNQSPFNAGVPVALLEFNAIQVLSLARMHGLLWEESAIEALMSMVGGHPYLVRLALYEISSGQITLERLLAEAATEAGIYSNHLRRHLEILQKVPELAKAFQQVVTSLEPVELDSMQIYKLHSLGLVQQQNNQVVPRCNLYRAYFRRVLSA
jgi:hypothetical protein